MFFHAGRGGLVITYSSDHRLAPYWSVLKANERSPSEAGLSAGVQEGFDRLG